MLFALTALVLEAAVAGPSFRAWLSMLDLRAFVALHLTRFVGIYFLILQARGQLPWAFAVPGGWGDIVVATLALAGLVTVQRLEQQAGLVLAWNVWAWPTFCLWSPRRAAWPQRTPRLWLRFSAFH